MAVGQQNSIACRPSCSIGDRVVSRSGQADHGNPSQQQGAPMAKAYYSTVFE